MVKALMLATNSLAPPAHRWLTLESMAFCGGVAGLLYFLAVVVLLVLPLVGLAS